MDILGEVPDMPKSEEREKQKFWFFPHVKYIKKNAGGLTEDEYYASVLLGLLPERILMVMNLFKSQKYTKEQIVEICFSQDNGDKYNYLGYC